MELFRAIAGFSRGSWSQIGYLPERAWINLSGPRRSCETQANSPHSHLTGRTKTSCLICESGSDSVAPKAKNQRFLAVENGRDTRSRTSKARLLLSAVHRSTDVRLSTRSCQNLLGKFLAISGSIPKPRIRSRASWCGGYRSGRSKTGCRRSASL
jgi:hypothetical protein